MIHKDKFRIGGFGDNYNLIDWGKRTTEHISPPELIGQNTNNLNKIPGCYDWVVEVKSDKKDKKQDETN